MTNQNSQTNLNNFMDYVNDVLDGRRVNKDQVINTIQNLAINHANTFNINELMDLARMYAYFVPSVNKSMAKKDLFAWVALAAARKDVRYYLNCVASNALGLQATDGHRMHIIHNDNTMPHGFYNEKSRHVIKDSENWNYPDIKRVVFSSKNKSEHTNIKLGDIKTKILPKINKMDVIQILGGKHKLGVDLKYWNDAIVTFSPDADVYLHDNQSRAALHIIEGNKEAVIMPMHIE